MKVPSKWSELTIDKFYLLNEASKLDFKNDEIKSFAILGAITGKEPEYFENIPINLLKKYLNDASFISTEIPKKKAAISFKLKNRRFEFDMYLRDSIASCFIDISEYAKSPNENIHNVLSIFAYELNWFGKRKPKTIKNQKEYAELFLKNLTIDLAMSYSTFFLNSWEKLQRATKTYLVKERLKVLKMAKKMLDHHL
jgi:hypothetical protein